MATFSADLTPSSSEDLNGTVSAGVSSSAIVVGFNRTFAINADGDVNVKLGATGVTAATAANFRVPSGVVAVYSTGNFQDRIRLFNNGSTTINYWIQFLTVG